jgi:hypothetical protein
MGQPSVSVAMAVCNAERFLDEAIESILGQSLRDFEFIIVDYGSTDSSKGLIRGYAARDGRIRLIEIPHCTLPEARNAGCFAAQGKYIAIMDADDVSLPDRLLREVDFLESHPQVALLGGAVEWIDSSGRSFLVHHHPTDDREIKSELLTHSVFWHPTIMIRKDAFVSVGGYRPAFVCAHDYDLAARIAEKYDCANLNEIVHRYRFHSLQISSDKKKLQALCILAVHASAAARRNREPDPLDTAREITSSALTAWGVGEVTQRNFVVADGHIWIRNLMNAGEYAAALSTARRILESNLDDVDPWPISEIHLCVAAINWREKRIWKYLVAVVRAILVRPVLVGRPLKLLIHSLKLA